jgi:sugar phosphate isomerase/epimerase
MQSRREFGKLALTGLSLSMIPTCTLADPKSDATVRGVKLGGITGAYGPFNAGPGEDVIDVVIRQSIATGAGHVELVNSVIEPPMGGACGRGGGGGRGGAAGAGAAPGAPGAPAAGAGAGRGGQGRGGGGGGFNGGPCGVGGQIPATITPEYTAERDKLRQWRLSAPLDRFREIRKKFDAAGLDLYSYVMTIGDDFTEEEIDAVFRHMQALSVDKFCTNQTRVAMGPRMAPYAEKYQIRPAFHTHQLSQDPNEVSSPESLAKLLAMSPLFMVNLDVGHYFDGGNDPLTYLKAHPERITHLHVRDANSDKTQADIGTGVLHVDTMLKFVRDNNYDIAFIVEQTGRADTTNNADALKMNIDYMRKVLES